MRGGSDSDAPKADSTGVASPDSLPTLSEPKLINQLESEIQSETGIFSTSPSKKVKVTIDDDLFGSIKVDQKPRVDSDDDLFATPAPSKPKSKKATESLFATSPPSSSKPQQPQPTASVFDSPPEDIFAPSPGTRQAAVGADDIFASSTTAASGSKNLDELLGSPGSKKGGGGKKAKVEAKVEETDGDKVRVLIGED